jgi:hypothetical protein
METPNATALLEGAMFEALSSPPDTTVWEWLEEFAYLSERESSTPGPFRTENRPYVREPLDCFRDKSVRDLILCFGTQTGKTLTVMGGAAWKLCNDPMNALWVMPNSDLAESFSKARWVPFIDSIEPLKKQKATDRRFFKFMEQFYARAILNFVGSNSPANLASRPAGLLLMDEVDKFAQKSSREAGALQNVEERAKTFPYPLKVKTSTPTTVFGEIWSEFLKGDQRYFHLSCPHCKRMIALKWAQVRWWENDESESKTDGDWDEEKVRRNTFYRCQECEGKILDYQKYDMIKAGQWIPTNPKAMAGTRSYHLNSLYAPLRECEWGILAVKWLQSKVSLTRRQAFINSTLAEPYDDESAIDDEPMNTREYSVKDLPEDRIPIMTVDVQENHFWVVIRSWGSPKAPGGQQSWLLFEGRVEAPEELENLQREYGVASKRVCLDMAHRPNMVGALLVKNGWRGLWGSDKTGFTHALGNGYRVQREYSPVQYRDPHLGTVHQSERNAKAMFLFWSNDRIKDRLEVLRFSDPPRWHVHSNITAEYVRQMNSERREIKTNRTTGRKTYYWKRLRRDNHIWDCESMQIVAALAGGVLEDSVDAASSNSPFKLDPNAEQ